jgi:hypothetical protein
MIEAAEGDFSGFCLFGLGWWELLVKSPVLTMLEYFRYGKES